ncbi:MAG: ion transporter, partial [Gammaproteobacteria bacterium]
MAAFNRTALKEHHEGLWLTWDLVMLGLLVLNLALLVFDTLYATQAVRQALELWMPAVAEAYTPVHANFTLVDLGFIGVFLSEFFIRWAIAVKRREYVRWYFFPFLHWYDLVGCIPVAGARIFRFLRIAAILWRLQKAEVIDLTQTRVFAFLQFYYNVFLEELSDRIVVKVLSDAQEDLRRGSPLIRQVREEVLSPRQPELYRWISSILHQAGRVIESEESGGAISGHVRESVRRAIRESEDIQRFSRLPVVGDTIEEVLEGAVTDVVVQSIIHLLKDFTPDRIANLAERVQQSVPVTDEERALDQEIIHLIDESLELIKAHVAQQRW